MNNTPSNTGQFWPTILLIISALTLCKSDSLVGFDCTNSEVPTTTFSLFSSNNCVKRSANLTTSTVLAQLVQIKNYEKNDYFACDVSYKIMITQCGGWLQGRNIVVNSYTYSKPISFDECETLHRSGIYKDPAFSWVQLHIKENSAHFAGNVVGSPDKGSCNGGHFTTHYGRIYNKVVVHYEIAVKLAKGTADIRLTDGTFLIANQYLCPYANRFCYTLLGWTFWNLIVPNRYCDTFGVVPLYTGKVTKQVEQISPNKTIITYSLLDPNESRMFLVEARTRSRICGHESHITQHTQIHIIESDTGSFNVEPTHNFSLKNLDPTIFHSLKISHVHQDVGTQMTKMYNEVAYQKCMGDNKIIANLLALSKIDPVHFGYLFFRVPGIYAATMGEVVHIVKCPPVKVELRMAKECYTDIPIFYQNEKVFLSPLSRIIKPKGTIGYCGASLFPQYKFNETWFMKLPEGYRQIDTPTELNSETESNWNFEQIRDIAMKGIYTSEELERYRTDTVDPLTMESRQLNLLSAIQDNTFNDDDSFISSFKFKDFHKLKDKFFGPFFSKFLSKLADLAVYFALALILYAIAYATKNLLEILFNCINLFRTFGFNFKTLLCCFDKGTLNTLNEERRQKEQQQNPAQTNNSDIEGGSKEPKVESAV